jgi:hypothetical protein
LEWIKAVGIQFETRKIVGIRLELSEVLGINTKTDVVGIKVGLRLGSAWRRQGLMRSLSRKKKPDMRLEM